jgi:hypothetical protein
VDQHRLCRLSLGRGYASLFLALVLSVSSGWARLSIKSLGLEKPEAKDLETYQTQLAYLAKITSQIQAFDDSIALREARAAGNLDSVMRGLRSDFKGAVVNCTMAAIKNVTKVDKIIKKLPPGPLKIKITRILRSPKTRKLLKKVEQTGEKIEEVNEKIEEAKGQVEQVAAFLKAAENEGVQEAVRLELVRAVRSEAENIFPLDLDQPVNEVVVDGFIELSKYFPATAPFTGVFESTAAITKKLVRVYEQNLHFDAIQRDLEEYRPIRLRQNSDRGKFLDSPIHGRMLRSLQRRNAVLRSLPLGSVEILNQIDFTGLRGAVSRYVSLPFKRAWKYHDNTALKAQVKILAERFQAVEKKLAALEERLRREDEKRAEKARQELLAKIRKGKNKPTGRSCLQQVGHYGWKSLLLTPDGKASSFGRLPGELSLGLDQLSRDLTRGAASIRVSARLERMIELVTNTDLEGMPGCGAWGGVDWNSGGIENALGRLKVSKELSRSGRTISPVCPGAGEVSLTSQSLKITGDRSMPVHFSWQERIPSGRKDHTGRMTYKTVTKSASKSCKYLHREVMDNEPLRRSIQVIGLKRLEVLDRNGKEMQDGAVYDFDPRPRVNAYLDKGEVIKKVMLSEIAEGLAEAGYVLKELVAKPESGPQQVQLWVQDSTGKKLLSLNYTINHFTWSLTVEGEQVSVPDTIPDVYVFGPGKIILNIEGPISSDAWTIDWGGWGRSSPTAGFPKKPRSGAIEIDLNSVNKEDLPVMGIQPVLKHRESGKSCYQLVPHLKRLEMVVRPRPPRLKTVEIREQVGGSVGLGGQAHGTHLFFVDPSIHGRSVRGRREVVFIASFRDEFDQEIPDGGLPTGLKLKNTLFEVEGDLEGVLFSRNILSVRDAGRPGAVKIHLVQPQIESRDRDHRTIFHPDFKFSDKAFFILRTIVRMIQTVDFQRHKPALMLMLEGPGNFDNFKVSWPLRRGGRKEMDLTSYPGGASSKILMEDVLRFREVKLLGPTGGTAASILLRMFRQSEAKRRVKHPRLQEFLRPGFFLAGQDNPLVGVIDDLDAFGAVSVRCQWELEGEGELKDGLNNRPVLDASLNQYRCTNRLRLPNEASESGMSPRIKLRLLQKGR